MRLKYLLFAILYFTIKLLHAQNVRPQYIFYEDKQTWLTYNLQYKTSDKWGLWFDINHRRGNYINNSFQSLLRFGVNHFYSPSVTISGGYAIMLPGATDARRISLEHRLWQQIMAFNKNESRDLFFRFRLEQRKFLYHYPREDGIYIRTRFAFIWQKHLNKKIDFLFLEEVMFQFGYYLRNLSPIDFQQNRLLGGFKVHLNKSLNMDIAYMHVLQYRNLAWDYNSNHCIRITLNHNLSKLLTGVD